MGPGRSYTSLRSVPQLNFTNYKSFTKPFRIYIPNRKYLSTKEAKRDRVMGDPTECDCRLSVRQPSAELQSLAHAAVIGRQLINIPMDWISESHISYRLTFNGPSIRCGSIEDDISTVNGTSIITILKSAPWASKTHLQNIRKFNDLPLEDLEWLYNATSYVGAEQKRMFAAMTPTDGPSDYYARGNTISNLYDSPYQFWVSVYGHAHTHKAYVCRLYNTSFVADFNKSGESTSIDLHNFSYMNEVVQHSVTRVDGTPRIVSWGSGGPYRRPGNLPDHYRNILRRGKVSFPILCSWDLAIHRV